MPVQTLGDQLAKAMAVDAEEGTEHHGDAVLFQMLDIVGRRARGEMPKCAAGAPSASQAPRSAAALGIGATLAPKAPVRPARTAPAGPKAAMQQPAHDDAKVRAAAAAGGALVGWSREHVEAALNDGVARGDTVVTAGGIVGKVAKPVKPEDTELTIEIADNVQIKVVKGTLSEVRPKNTPAND